MNWYFVFAIGAAIGIAAVVLGPAPIGGYAGCFLLGGAYGAAL